MCIRDSVHGVALLPQKLAVAQEGAGGLLPAQDATPLVIHLRQVPVGLDDVAEMLAEQRLRRGTDAVALFQLVAAAHSNPSALRGKALDVVLLLLQEGFGNQHLSLIHIWDPHRRAALAPDVL